VNFIAETLVKCNRSDGWFLNAIN